LEETIFAKLNKQCGHWMLLNNYQGIIRDDNRFGWQNLSSDLVWSKYKTKARFNFCLDIKHYTNIEHEGPMLNISMTFDIETYKDNSAKTTKTKDIVCAENIIFNITAVISGATERTVNIYHLRDGSINADMNIGGNVIDIPCKSERELIQAWILLLEQLQPDFIYHYNGGGFDIPQILLKSRLHGLFDEMYCRSSIYYSDNYDESTYNKNVGFQVSKGGYNNWGSISTTVDISGIPRGMQNIKRHGLPESFKLEKGISHQHHYWSPPGSISIDMYIVCMKRYPKEPEKNMNAFLRKFGIASKLDMDYADMWRYWSTNDLAHIRDIFVYCEYDSRACWLLTQALLLMEEKREMSKITSLPLRVVLYRADTVKVSTMTYKKAAEAGYVCIEKKVDTKYNKNLSCVSYLQDHLVQDKLHNTGALVQIFKRGKIYADYSIPTRILEHIPGTTAEAKATEITNRTGMEATVNAGRVDVSVIMPVEADDFASLYPSIMITFNLSREMITQVKSELPETRPDGSPFIYKTHSEASLPKQFADINPDIYIQDHGDVRANMGIIPRYLLELYDLRTSTRVDIAKYKESKPTLTKDTPEYIHTTNMINVLSAKQQAIKVIMNTAYGATSFNFSEIYYYIIPFLTTLYGRTYLTHANNYLRANGCTVCYNDTDSAYFYHAITIFADIIDRMLIGAIDMSAFDRKMVTRSMKETLTKQQRIEWYTNKPLTPKREEILASINEDTFNDRLNNKFKELSGYGYLAMVREETLYPAMFCALKKYFGVKYESSWKENITIKDYLLRGLSLVSRTANEFLSTFTEEMISMVINTRKTGVYDIVINLIIGKYDDVAHNRLGSINHFENKKRYKPEVTNGIVDNMRLIANTTDNAKLQTLCEDPDPLEYIRYVTCQPINLVDLKFRNIDNNKSQDTYYSKVAEYLQMQPDYLMYIHTLFSTCAQFLSYNFGKQSDTAKVCKELAEKHLLTYFKEYESNLDIVLDKIKLVAKVKSYANKGLYARWININYANGTKALLLMLENCSVQPIVMLTNYAESIEVGDVSIDPVYRDIEKVAKMERISYIKLIKHKFVLNCINTKMINRFNSVLKSSSDITDFGNPLSPEDIENAALIYKDLIVYTNHHSVHRLLIKQRNTNIAELEPL
jgi:DNA polymerase elongation subunit (family B)